MRSKKLHPSALPLFETRLVWEEFSVEVRQRSVELLAELCVDVVSQEHPVEKESADEPR
jgi:hypothetical protein